MKKENLYYHMVYQRRNVVKIWILTFFFNISSIPRIILEVFYRRNMGERYFSLVTSITAFLFMFFGANIIYLHGGLVHESSFISTLFLEHPSNSIFSLVFLAMAILRDREIKRKPGVFDFKKFTGYTGDILPFFYGCKIDGKEPTRKMIATLYEPGAAFIFGLLLRVLGLEVGVLIMVCSFIYSQSYVAAHYLGDQYLMDAIDQIILNEDLTDTMVNGTRPEDKRGFEFYGTVPDDEGFRRTLADTMLDDDPATEVF